VSLKDIEVILKKGQKNGTLTLDDMVKSYPDFMKKSKHSEIWHYHPSVINEFGFWSLMPVEKREFHRFENEEKLFEFVSKLEPTDRMHQLFEKTFSVHKMERIRHTYFKGNNLPDGQYIFRESDYPIPERLIPIQIRNDTFCANIEGAIEAETDVKHFLESESIYKELGIPWRRGYLFHGVPGNGKTSIIRNILKNTLPKNAITIWLRDEIPSESMLFGIKKEAEHRIVVFVLEELMSVIKERSVERFLEFLDGEISVDRSIFIATTNEIQNLPQNMTNRPSRFDMVYEVTNPNVQDRKKLLEIFLGEIPSDEMILLTENFSIAYIKEAVILQKVKKISLIEAIKRTAKIKKIASSGFSKRSKIGITHNTV